uniref:Uncharacterized protein n=1 Tax=Bicosoecida sp. CB-2014 TaxID=1486930 RepID=A0A7S1C255_9STRA
MAATTESSPLLSGKDVEPAAPKGAYGILVFNSSLNFIFFGIVGVLYAVLTDTFGLGSGGAAALTNTFLSAAYGMSMAGAALASSVGERAAMCVGGVVVGAGVATLLATGVADAPPFAPYMAGVAAVVCGYGLATPSSSTLLGLQFDGGRHSATTIARWFGYWYSSVQLGAVVAVISASSALSTGSGRLWPLFAVDATLIVAALALLMATTATPTKRTAPSDAGGRNCGMLGCSRSRRGSNAGDSESDGDGDGDADAAKSIAGGGRGGDDAGCRTGSTGQDVRSAHGSGRSLWCGRARATASVLVTTRLGLRRRGGAGGAAALSEAEAAALRGRFGAAHAADGVALARVAVVFCPLPVYWTLYFQMFGLWQVTATAMDNVIAVGGASVTVPPSDVTSLDPLFVLLLTPLFVRVLYPRYARFFGGEIRRMTIGLVGVCGVFALAGGVQAMVAAAEADGTARPSLALLVPQFLLNAAAEILVTVTGVEFAFTQVPRHLKATVAALLWLTVALGNEAIVVLTLCGVTGDGSPTQLSRFYWACAGGLLVVTAAFWRLTRGLDGEGEGEGDKGGAVRHSHGGSQSSASASPRRHSDGSGSGRSSASGASLVDVV